jgi:TetR/AcrR family transcriptional regulator, transcriptional repressor for nem operon
MTGTTGTKGTRTRQRIVELAAPVFNRQGYVGASMRDLISAIGLEKSRVTDGLARSQDGATDAIDRLQRMIRAFATFARKPAIAGGCPIMNTAIEADDTHPELRERAQTSMTLWHRLIGRIVKDGIAAGTLVTGTDPYALAALVTGSLEGGLMLSRLYGDPSFIDRIVEHLTTHVDALRAQREEAQ